MIKKVCDLCGIEEAAENPIYNSKDDFETTSTAAYESRLKLSIFRNPSQYKDVCCTCINKIVEILEKHKKQILADIETRIVKTNIKVE